MKRFAAAFMIAGLLSGCVSFEEPEKDEKRYHVSIYDRETEETIEFDCYEYYIHNEDNQLVTIELQNGDYQEIYEKIGDLRVEVTKN